MGKIGGRASAEIDAPLDACYAAAVDAERAPKYQRVEKVQVVERDGDGRPALVSLEIDAGIRSIKTRLRYSYSPPTRITWRQEKGDLSSLDGSWTFEDLGGGRTRATYEMRGDPGFGLGLLISGGVEAKVRARMVEAVPGAFKRYVEAALIDG